MHARLIPLVDADEDEEVTIYVKGFLGRGETPGRFDAWLAGHRKLEVSHGWSPHAMGYQWESGRLRKLALPIASSAKTAWDIYRVVRHTRRLNPLAMAGWFLAEQATALSFRFVEQFVEARREAQFRAEDLATCLESLAEEGRRVRVVAHSLGCRHVIESSSQLTGSARPHEIHLCAPACLEEEVEDKLANLAQEDTYLYYTPLDHVLDISFRAMAKGRALGAAGVDGQYANLHPRDVSSAFDFWVHTEYKNRFNRFVERPDAAPDDPR